MPSLKASRAGNVTGTARGAAINIVVQRLQAGEAGLQVYNLLRGEVKGLTAANASAIYAAGQKRYNALANPAGAAAAQRITSAAYQTRTQQISPVKYIIRARVLDRGTGQVVSIIVPISAQAKQTIQQLTESAQADVDENYAGQGFGLAPISERGAVVESIEILRAYTRG